MKKRIIVIASLIIMTVIAAGYYVWNNVTIPAKVDTMYGRIATINYMHHTDKKEGNVHLVDVDQIEQSYWLYGKQHYIVREDDGCECHYVRKPGDYEIVCTWVAFGENDFHH